MFFVNKIIYIAFKTNFDDYSDCVTINYSFMTKKKQTKQIEHSDGMTLWEKQYRRYCLIHGVVILVGIAIMLLIYHFTNPFFGIMALAFGVWSWGWYENGAQENCVDEWEYAYPDDGFRRMVASWPWFIGLAVIAYSFCINNMPQLFE